MAANPVAATVYAHCRSKKHNIMSDSDQKVLEKWLFSDLSLNNAGIILALYSGMRLGEVCAARWGNYDAMSGTLHITQTVRRVMVDPAAEYGKRTELIFSSAKSDASERDLYLPEVLQGLLTVQYQRFESLFKRTPNADDFIIYNTVGGVMDPDHLSSYWGDVLDGLGLPHVRFHDIRHTFATRTIEQGIDVATVAGLLGHADVTTTTHYYVHPRDASMRKAMAAVAPVGAVTHAWQNTRLFAPKSAEEKVPEAARRASVHPEPGSNSLKFVSYPPKRLQSISELVLLFTLPRNFRFPELLCCVFSDANLRVPCFFRCLIFKVLGTFLSVRVSLSFDPSLKCSTIITQPEGLVNTNFQKNFRFFSFYLTRP